ncbi:unnamed protein product [Thelazia callipaeda]|uniref:Myosin motor domain-containing protein n=1 Tax=Thelazia callipaeda TaxID=103827 RepID=A0A158RBD0_THECL|nr:unnamed protein product [Thelazia callipaeda]
MGSTAFRKILPKKKTKNFRLLEVPIAHRETTTNNFQTTIWINDPDTVFRLATVLEERNEKLLVGFRDENGYYEKLTVPKSEVQLSSTTYFVDDMCNLSELNDACVLQVVRSRYQADLIHTYSGLFCLVVNPWKNIPIYTKEIMEVYMNTIDKGYNLPPHVYAVAQSAYDGLLSGSNQSILITGESGAGKTVNTKRIIEYLGAASECRNGSLISGGINERLSAAGIIIEAFANASTIHNSNSSRLGKFIRMDYGDDLIMKGAQIQFYLLEKSRVVKQNDGDHGFDKNLRHSMGLTQKSNAYRFLNQGDKTVDPEVNDIQGLADTLHAMEIIKFSKNEIIDIFEVLAACILLGEIKFKERSGLDITYIDGVKEIQAACKVLGVKTSNFIDAITQPSIKVNDLVIRKNQNLAKTLSSLSALCKAIYERLFSWILSKCNLALSETFHPSKSVQTYYIGVLDIAGFEIIKMNSFEQFCINYTNEKLQQFFNDFMFIREQQEYLSEGIDWRYADYGTDMQNTIEFIEKPLGLLSLLQEECLVPNGKDQSLLEKLLSTHSSSPIFARSKQSVRRTTVSHFSITHYAGKIQYNIDGWVEKNKDSVERNGLEVLATSTKPLLRLFFPPLCEEKLQSKRQSKGATTVSHTYKEQLLNLMDTLNSTMAHFIRCIAPNRKRLPGIIDSHLVFHQLRCNGVLEGVRICRQGYPNRMAFAEFVERYRILAIDKDNDLGRDRSAAQKLCESIELNSECVQIGKSKVYCKVGVISELEARRKNYLNKLMCQIQAYIRWYLQQQNFKRLLHLNQATVIVQKNVRNFAEITTWRWYRILLAVKELIPLNKDKKRLEELLIENDELVKLENDEKLHIQKSAEMKEEMAQHEELMEIMEKRFDEQHAKVMVSQKNEREYELRRKAEHDLEIYGRNMQEMELKMELMNKERDRELNQVQECVMFIST